MTAYIANREPPKNVPDGRTFYANSDKAVLMLFGSIAFVAGGYYLRLESPFIAWASMIFFGFCFVCSVFLMVSPRFMYLRVDPEGFETGSLLRKARTKWTEVKRFELVYSKVKMIQIVYAPHYQKLKALRWANKLFTGMEGGFTDIYDAPLTEVLAVLREWHSRYGAAGTFISELEHAINDSA